MAFPHPQSRQDHCRKKNKPSWSGVAWKFFKRTVNITVYRNAQDDVNPAKNRTLGGTADHNCLRKRGWWIVLRDIVSAICRFMTFDPPEAANWAVQRRAALRTRRSIVASRR